MCLRLALEPVQAFVAVDSESAAEDLMTRLLPRLTSDWEGKPFLFTYPRAFHAEIEQALLHGARAPQHWLQPVSLHTIPDDGPRILWRSGHPSVQNATAPRPLALRGSAPEVAVKSGAGAGDSEVALGPGTRGFKHVGLATAAAFDAVRCVSRHGRLVASSSVVSALAISS